MTMAADLAEELAFLSAGQLTEAYAAGRLSPVEVIEATLTRVAEHGPVLNAFCLVDREAALADARAAEDRWRSGAPLGPLDGVPISIKDLVLTRGWPTRRGSRTVAPDQAWDEDGPAVARLREAGVVLFGKTTTPEFAFRPVTTSPLTGVTRNPWNPALTPGGSSGGAGAAVAAGMGPLALGTDAGGSIRIPASFCGIFGLKPSGGRVPMYPPTPLASLVGFGPMSRTVADSARMLSAISRPDPRDWGGSPYDAVAYHEHLAADPSSWRIAWSPTLGFADVDPEIAEVTAEAVTAFEKMGAHVEEVAWIMDDPAPLMTRLRRGYTSFAFRHLTAEDMAVMDPFVAEEIEASRGADLESHLAAEMERVALGRRMIALHEDYDLLVTPTLAAAPFPVEQANPAGHGRYDWTGFCIPFNLTRQPAASVPCGTTPEGLPVGLQIVGAPHADLTVLQAAYAFEAARPWAHRRPNLEPLP